MKVSHYISKLPYPKKVLGAIILLVLVCAATLGISIHQKITVVSDVPQDQEFTWEEYTKAKDSYIDLLKHNDPTFVLTTLREKIKTDNKLSHSCHAIVHEIGHAAYKKYGSFSGAMKYQDEVCNSGYLHGIIESVFSETNEITKTMNTLCGVATLHNYVNWQCYHGIGHGVMFFTKNNLPKSLELCDTYKDTFARSSCINGVFMENFNVDQDSHVSTYVSTSNPMYPCNKQAVPYKNDCYLYAPTYYLFLHKNNYKGALLSCDGAETAYGSTCAQGVGSQAIKDNINNPKTVERICMSNHINQIGPCITGMATLYSNHFGSTTPTLLLCKKLLFFNRGFCYQAVESQLPLFF